MAGLPKNAWLRIHKPEVYYSTELTEYEQSVMEMGIEVEHAARGLFPDGAIVTGLLTDALHESRSLIASKPRTLFQPVFELEEFLAVIDILQCEPQRDEWSIYEVKSGTKRKKNTFMNGRGPWSSRELDAPGPCQYVGGEYGDSGAGRHAS